MISCDGVQIKMKNINTEIRGVHTFLSGKSAIKILRQLTL